MPLITQDNNPCNLEADKVMPGIKTCRSIFYIHSGNLTIRQSVLDLNIGLTKVCTNPMDNFISEFLRMLQFLSTALFNWMELLSSFLIF